MNVLFVGNSYTYYNDMPLIFKKLADDNNRSMTVHSVTKGGRRLESFTDKSDDITVKLQDIVSKEKFDVCFIQEQSVLPAADFDRFINGLSCVVDMVKDKADQIVLYATWGRKSGSETLTEHNWTTESMTKLLSDAYCKASEQFGAKVSPVGENFLKIEKTNPEINLHDEDLSHPSYKGSCLAALTHYYTVFGEFPKKIQSLDISADELSAFQKVVGNLL